MSETSVFWKFLGSVSDQGRRLIRGGSAKDAPVDKIGRTLVEEKGEAAGVALAELFIERYRQLDDAAKAAFFTLLHDDFGPDDARLDGALAAYRAGDPAALSALHYAAEPLRQELLRRINVAPGGITALVGMRADLLDAMRANPDLAVVDTDFQHLFKSWFNRGFLVLERIGWRTPAAILERIIRSEAVHAFEGWEDLRRRVDTPDRRLYAFFHPALADSPLIFVQVALMRDMPAGIQEILAEDRTPVSPREATTAVFYSISNCERGLRGVTFGNFLIKQVVDDLRHELEQLRSFVTLSPVPGLRRWLADAAATDDTVLTDQDRQILDALIDGGAAAVQEAEADTKKAMLGLVGHFLVREKAADGRPADPVARFHLGNGARLDRLNWQADTGAQRIAESHGIMVNYRYVIDEIEANHEAFANRGTIAMSSSVRRSLRAQRAADRAKPRPAAVEPDGS